jgi:hypothetical protein
MLHYYRTTEIPFLEPLQQLREPQSQSEGVDFHKPSTPPAFTNCEKSIADLSLSSNFI